FEARSLPDDGGDLFALDRLRVLPDLLERAVHVHLREVRDLVLLPPARLGLVGAVLAPDAQVNDAPIAGRRRGRLLRRSRGLRFGGGAALRRAALRGLRLLRAALFDGLFLDVFVVAHVTRSFALRRWPSFERSSRWPRRSPRRPARTSARAA